MGEKMYVDVLLLENLIINLLLLKVTQRFSKIKTSRLKIFIGAAVGAVYVIAAFFSSYEILYILPVKIAVSVLMVTIAFTPKLLQDFLKALGIFYIISFAFGGAAFALFYFTQEGQIINGMFYISGFPFSLLITAFAIGYLLLVYCWGYIQGKILKDELKYTVNIKLDDKEISVEAILDTGNSLKDPITGFPVIVIEYDIIKDILPDKLSSIFNQSGHDIDFTVLGSLMDNTDWINRLRLIPYTSLGKQNGMLVGLRPDLIVLHQKNKNFEIKDVIVGIYHSKISKNGEYGGLLYPEIIK
ncbi:sporulation sigma-E factor-processing peptidase [Oxobacter pfennigii]|uniref:Sporulation sigma-E factor-processing peptidase n=1 Tax=Oxobacter pfennigii TaxID=36849 RepID=A0A0P8W8H9_9CLOT|nr:sigma-E processing peptidase SpoIIGA [Oxobacter pfennigii]KPU44031.1 sporulation sigma-E factor-processing peptidase [Oxobacter pfennigii]